MHINVIRLSGCCLFEEWDLLRFPTANFDETTAQFFGVLVMKDFTDLVYMKESFALADSLGVAKHFNKQHKNVMQAIDNIIKADAYQSRLAEGLVLFVLKYKISELQNNKPLPYYEITYFGMFVLISEFSGKLAQEFRIRWAMLGFNEAWEWLSSLTNFQKRFDQLYVVLYKNGTVKVGKGVKALSRIKTHSSNAHVHNNPVVEYSIELEPKITEMELIDFCKCYGKSTSAKEFFIDLCFEDVVRFMKYQKVPRISTKFSMRMINSANMENSI